MYAATHSIKLQNANESTVEYMILHQSQMENLKYGKFHYVI